MTPLSRWRNRRRRIRAALWLDREIRRAAYERLAGRPDNDTDHGRANR